MAQIYGNESWFNEDARFFKNINVGGKITAKDTVPGIDAISEGILATSKNRIFVSIGGDDTNSGLSADDPVRTIKKAAEIATNNFTETDKKTIYVSSGEYTEDIPIILPRFCAIVGDSLRTVVVRPGKADVDFFKVREGIMLMNLVFKDNEERDFTFRYGVAYDDSQGKLILNQSPYVLNCSVISTRGRGKNAYSIVGGEWTKGAEQSPRGCLAHVDGDLVEAVQSGKSTGGNLESMVFALLSIITPGIGIHISNSAYAQIVNVFGIFNTDHILCESGGYASITNSATNFGINALRAAGFSTVGKTYSQDVGIVTFSCASAVGVGSTSFITIAGAASSIPASQSIISIVDDGSGDGFAKPKINNLLRFGYGDSETNFTHSSTEFQIRKVSDVRSVVYDGDTRVAYDVAVSPRLDQHFNATYTQYSDFNDVTARQLRPSIVNSSSHTWEYAGSGTDYDALPKNGGVSRENNEQVEENYGKVYSSGTNELGDFKVGNFVVLRNNTGEVQFITPLPIAQIDRITFTSGNTNLTITGVQDDITLGGDSPSNDFLVTQRAANLYVKSGIATFTNKTFDLTDNTLSGTLAEFNTALSDDDFVSLTGSETLTNKSLSGSSNTFTNIPNNALSNSSISGVSLGSTLPTLTLNTSGAGISGSATYNATGAATFTVTSNATSASGNNTIALRDGNGNVGFNSVSAAEVSITGALYDTFGNAGIANQLLATTGASSIQWVNANTTSVGSATSIGVTQENNTNATRHLTFVADTSGTDNIRIDTGLTYNPSSNTLSAGTFSGNLSGTLSNTLTLNTSGTGLSGSTTFNNSGAATFTVTSNATSSNTASTVVARDSSGNFSAGTITATFSGNGSSLNTLNASEIDSGTVSVNRLGSSGTRDSTTFLRGDNTWQVVQQTLSVTAKSTNYTLAAGDVGSIISISSGNITVPQNVFDPGETVLVYNNSSSSRSIIQGTNVTLRLPGTSDTGNRTVQQRGLITVLCIASNEFIVTGSGLL